jgi:hypothetical protein
MELEQGSGFIAERGQINDRQLSLDRAPKVVASGLEGLGFRGCHTSNPIPESVGREWTLDLNPTKPIKFLENLYPVPSSQGIPVALETFVDRWLASHLYGRLPT